MAGLLRMTADRVGTMVAFGVAVAGAYYVGRQDAGGRGLIEHARSGGRAVQAGRGRQADTPAQIPVRGWWDILKRTFAEASEDRLLLVAAGVVFYALLALFPAMSAMISLYGLVADPATMREHIGQVAFMLPQGALGLLTEQADRLASAASSNLSLALLGSIAIALWSANAGMKALIDGLNIVYEEGEKRSFVRLNLVSLALTLGAILFVLSAIAAIIVLPAVLNLIGGGGPLAKWLSLGRWPLVFLAIMVALAVLYRYGPSRGHPRFSWVTPGSLVAAVLWLVGSAILSYYISNFGHYDETYGSLGAAIGLMIWLWLSAIVVLLGGELNAEAEHQTARDTTSGEARPLGARGAHMADTVAPDG